MKIAYSPCPNDTFVFHAWAHNLISDAPQLDVTYADIDITNRWAIEEGGPDIMKISCATLPWVLSRYALIPCGGALGRGCGPLVLVRQGQEKTPVTLVGKRVAVPSEQSTAYLLFRLWAEQYVRGGIGEIKVLPFHEIMPAVRAGTIDAGLVIHEARFTYHTYELESLVDLGAWWETDTGLPIPLGAIIARRSMDIAAITGWIRASVEYAWRNPQASKEYVLHHAQELDPEVAQAHIDLYVNEFTANLGAEGYEALNALLGRAMQNGLVPQFDLSTLK